MRSTNRDEICNPGALDQILKPMISRCAMTMRNDDGVSLLIKWKTFGTHHTEGYMLMWLDNIDAGEVFCVCHGAMTG